MEKLYNKEAILKYMVQWWCNKERATNAIESNYDFVCRVYPDENTKTIANIIRSLWVN